MSKDNRTEEQEEPRRRPVTAMTSAEASRFFLRGDVYSQIDLPLYFRFDSLLAGSAVIVEGAPFVGKGRNNVLSKAGWYDHVNYILMGNKNGEYAWRPMALAHPVLYASLVNVVTEPSNWAEITARFRMFRADSCVECLSLPVESLTKQKNKAEQINQWWQGIEQKSIELSLDYEFLFRTDITDCYPSLYTHTIAWALHTRELAKNNRKDDSVGNLIDRHLQWMHNGQTNGVPQGSALMDFIAEMVLGYADVQLSDKMRGRISADCCILRYRDDYRIFVNSLSDGRFVLNCLNEVMTDLGLKLNPAKTGYSSQVIQESVKHDKLTWMFRKQSGNLQNQLMAIHDHGLTHLNAGSVERALTRFYRRLHRRWAKGRRIGNVQSLISIAVDIAYRNPRSYRIVASILSVLLASYDNEQDKMSIIKKIVRKFSLIPNTGYLDLWLQRISIPFNRQYEFSEELCKIPQGKHAEIWNNEWLTKLIKPLVTPEKMIDDARLAGLSPVVPPEEVDLYIPEDGEYR